MIFNYEEVFSSACEYVHVSRVHTSQTCDCLELEFRVLVSLQAWVLGTQPGSFGRAAISFNG